jgi:hypothetical protein
VRHRRRRRDGPGVHIGAYLAGHGPMEKGIGDVRRRYEGELVFAEELIELRV